MRYAKGPKAWNLKMFRIIFLRPRTKSSIWIWVGRRPGLGMLPQGISQYLPGNIRKTVESWPKPSIMLTVDLIVCRTLILVGVCNTVWVWICGGQLGQVRQLAISTPGNSLAIWATVYHCYAKQDRRIHYTAGCMQYIHCGRGGTVCSGVLIPSDE